MRVDIRLYLCPGNCLIGFVVDDRIDIAGSTYQHEPCNIDKKNMTHIRTDGLVFKLSNLGLEPPVK